MDKELAQSISLAEKISKPVVSLMSMAIEIGLKGRSRPFTSAEKLFLTAYCFAYCDVLSQYAGCECGGHISLLSTRMALEAVLGSDAKKLYPSVINFLTSDKSGDNFCQGIDAGNYDGNARISDESQNIVGAGSAKLILYFLNDGN